jgi:hypothetical protein
MIMEEVRKLREKLRKMHNELSNEFRDVILKIDNTLEELEGKDGN